MKWLIDMSKKNIRHMSQLMRGNNVGLFRLSVQKVRAIILIGLLCLISFVLSTKNITHESTISFQGDMPKYLMNGVYFHDLLKDFPISGIMGYTYQYYAKYPSLSLGHHPIVLSIFEAPFYALFGISVFSARLCVSLFMVLSAILWFITIKKLYNEQVAFFSCLLFITTRIIVEYSRLVMSEIPALFFICLSFYFFNNFLEKRNRNYCVLFLFSLFLSIYSRYTSVFLLPIFIIRLLIEKDNLMYITKKNTAILLTTILVFLSPAIAIVMKYSQANLSWVVHKSFASRLELSNTLYYLEVIWKHHLSMPVIALSLASILFSIYRRDKKSFIFVLWIVGFYLQITLTGARVPRYALYWIPAFCLFAAMTIEFFQHRLWKACISVLLVVISTYQFIVGFQMSPEYADGYEEAAQYVLEHPKGESVLFNGSMDTGYFVFFVRKHDPSQSLIVLRADKMLVTSKLDQIVEERVTSREEIYGILQDYGVGYVVTEDQEAKSLPLQWLREELQSDRFVRRKQIPIRSNDRMLRNSMLTIYEYKDYTPPKRGKILQMNIPLMGDSIAVRFDALLRRNHTEKSLSMNNNNGEWLCRGGRDGGRKSQTKPTESMNLTRVNLGCQRLDEQVNDMTLRRRADDDPDFSNEYGTSRWSRSNAPHAPNGFPPRSPGMHLAEFARHPFF